MSHHSAPSMQWKRGIDCFSERYCAGLNADERDRTDECFVSCLDITKMCLHICQLETICVLVRWILEDLLLVRKPWHIPLYLCYPLAPWSIRCNTLPLVCHPYQILFLNLLVVSLMYQLMSLPWHLGRCRLLHE